MVDIQSLTAEIRRGKKRRTKSQHENIIVCPITQGDHNKVILICCMPFSRFFFKNKKNVVKLKHAKNIKSAVKKDVSVG